MRLLTDKVAIITGASSGIGYATAKLFAEEGAKLVLCSREEKKLIALVDEINSSGGKAIALVGDVKDEILARNLVEMALSSYGRLDIAFNNAGILGSLGATSEMELSDWHETINTNLTSAFLGAKYQLPAMKKKWRESYLYLFFCRIYRRNAKYGSLCRK